MILIADSGSTKTTWALVTGKQIHAKVDTEGMNPYFTSSERMELILRHELLPQMDDASVHHIHFYGAGCSTGKNNMLIHDHLASFFPRATIAVDHDILGAARALFGKSKGIACILGTGSNSCFYDGEAIHSIIPSLGYLFGDEGAGSSLGKKLIGKVLKDELPDELKQAFNRKYNFSLEDILTSLYKKPFPNRFLASFSFFLKEQAHHPLIYDMIYASFIEFIEAHITRYNHYDNYPAGFTGSIASVFHDILREALAAEDITLGPVMQDPVDGLVAYHARQ